MRALLLAAVFACLTATSPAGQDLEQAPPGASPPATGGELPGAWYGPGPLHKVFLDAPADSALELLRASGALRAQVDHGAFVMAIVDGEAFGGQAAFELAGIAVRDEHDLMPFDGYVLDGTRPEETLALLDPAERLGSARTSLPPLEAGLYVVQFRGPVKDAWLALAGLDGVRFRQALPMNAYVVQLAPGDVLRLDALRAARGELQYFGVYQPAFRMTANIRAAARTNGTVPLPVTLQVIDGAGVRATLDRIGELSATPPEHMRVGPYLNVRASLAPDTFRSFAADPSVFAIEELGTRTRTAAVETLSAPDERQGQIGAGNVSGTGPSAPTYLSWLASMGFGSGQFTSFAINVVDDATSLTGHPDLASSRVAFTQNPTSQSGSQGGHGFLNAHIAAGFNSSTSSAVNDSGGYNYGLGIAPWARVGSTAIFGPGGLNPASYESSAYNLGARISTNSWSFQSGGNPIPDYDSWAQTYDFIVRDARSSQGGNQDYMVLFSASNDGPGSNTVSTPATAKNILTVGASENNRQTGTDGCGVPNSGANSIADIISFSSMGPVNASGGDGRWKPEIVAPGTHIQAGVPQSNYNGSSVCNQYWPGGQTLYGWSSGTSHSTPAVAGSAALVHQWFLNQGLPAPSAAMKKAVIVGSGEYLTGAFANDTLPSNSQGMGRVDLGNVLGATGKIVVDQTVLLTGTGGAHVETGAVDSTSSPFRVTLVWTDAPGPTSGAPYVNNLDLTVTVGGLTYRGNRFSGSTSITGGAADFRNNTESVFLPAGTSGSFTVNVTAASIGGDGVPGNGDSTDQDFALFIENGSTGPPGAPVANFVGSPTSGPAPLAVAFTDLSSGTVSTRSWTFGDGGTSTLANPGHTYTSQGTYTVTLSITGPGGSDTETKTSYITVNPPPAPGVSDGSFESQAAGTVPTTPWSVTFGAGHVVNPSGVSSDNGMPTDGVNWCEIAADSTNDSTPPSNPGGVTAPPVGGAGIAQSFSYPSGQTTLEFEAAFLRNEDADQTVFNDWMSVDVSDGSTTRNLYYKDTFSPTSGTSVKWGFAMTPVETVSVDLTSLFPGSTTGTTFTLTAQVGNGNDDIQPSKGYVDDFRLAGGVAAPVAEFSGTPTSGTAPLAVAFTDGSTGSIAGWFWDFGDGNTSVLQNPGHTYNSTGSYNVALTVSGPGGSDTETKDAYVVVSDPAPVAEFSGTPTSGTAPLAVVFTDASTGSIAGWFWDFGDGNTSFLQNPSHTYGSAGSYTVALTVSGPGGSDTETKNAYVVVSDPAPVAEFSGTPTSGTAPLAVAFTDASTGSIAGWFWDFGDGNVSVLQNPGHTYNGAGSYNVALTVSGPGGSDTETKNAYIVVSEPAPVAEFSGTPTSGTAPLAVSFTDASTGSIAGWFWDFGDGNTSVLQNPSHTYNGAGSYNVALTVSGPGGSDTETKNAYIVVSEPAPVAEFSGTPTSGTAPLAVSFTDASTGSIAGWFWDFGDGNVSVLQNPGHTYNGAGSYNVALTVSGPGGSDTETKNAYIVVSEPAPVAEFSGSPTSGTAPLAVSFTDASTGAIAGWFWDFGDGNTSVLQNPSHTYNASGSYNVALTVSGPGGSDTETKNAYVVVSDPAPVAEFSGTPTSGTEPLNVFFSDLSSGPVTSWAWSFGDGGASTDQNPIHTYTSAGTYTVSLTATGPGGSDGETKTDYITVDPSTLGTNYCGSVPNSTGSPATIEATGSDVVADQDLTLRALSLPQNQFGYFLTSQTQGFVANPGGSAGNLCLGGTLGRFIQQVQNSGTAGEFSIVVDLNAMPLSPPVAVQAGETWHYQCWYRDGATSNFTDGVSIAFL